MKVGQDMKQGAKLAGRISLFLESHSQSMQSDQVIFDEGARSIAEGSDNMDVHSWS